LVAKEVLIIEHKMTIRSNLITDFFLNAEGLSPNSYQATIKALGFIENLSRFQKIANIASGTGRQTEDLCQATDAQIIAVEFVDEYVEYLKAKLKTRSFGNRICPVLTHSEYLPFRDGELDMIWAESLTDNISFESALNKWNKYLKKDGYIGLCSYCWLTDNPPEIVSEYWGNNTIEINSISCRIKQLTDAGFIPAIHFVMPDECWWNYFCPLEENFNKFRQKHPNDSDAEKLINDIDREINLYQKYGEYYGYVFFIGKKY